MKFGSITTGIIADGLVFNMDAANRASYTPPSSLINNTLNFLQSGSFQDSNGSGMYNPNKTFAFDGVDDYILINNTPQTNFNQTNSFTISGWFFISQNDANSPFFGKWGTNSNSTGNYMLWSGAYSSNKIVFSVANGSSTAASVPAAFNYNYDRTRWNNFVGVYNAGTSLQLYVNGELIDTTLYTGNINSTQTSLGVNYASYGGGLYHWQGSGNCYNIYNRALSANEVLHNYNALKGRFGL